MNELAHQEQRGRNRHKSKLEFLIRLAKVFAITPYSFRYWVFSVQRNSGSAFARALRFVAIRTLAESCGELVDIKGNVYMLGLSSLSVGSRVSIHPFSYIDATGGLFIGNDVSIAHSVSILSTEHEFLSRKIPIRDQGVRFEPTIIESDVWVGAGARILGGVKIGTGSIIASGAVVTKDVPPFSISAGIPARVISTRP